ncbi:hypothetical protein [Arthrobacter ulcerisalmonis]|uniref:hypothetical protein n=1 Tax=Arthrobacter ulcerisalmonis TaxID=2483813 RepID=UPI003624BE9A
MIPNVSTGSRMFGLVQYLAGPGRANEHTNMHVVCASEQIVSVLDRQELDTENTRALGHEMNFPKKAFRVSDDNRDHVLHVSLSLDPDQLGSPASVTMSFGKLCRGSSSLKWVWTALTGRPGAGGFPSATG